MRDIIIFSDADYTDTPYRDWLPADRFRLHALVPQNKMEQYRTLDHVYGFNDYRSAAEVEETAMDVAGSRRAAAVLARAEVDIIRAARVREAHAIGGQKLSSAISFRDKFVMKTCLRRNGIDVAEFAKVEDPWELERQVHAFGYPCVVKPLASSGSVGTRVLWEPQDLADYLAKPFSLPLLVESYVDGPMYHVDGLVENGTILFTSASRYINDCLAWMTDDFVASCVLDSTNPLAARLVRYTDRILQSFEPLECSTFHCEIFHTPDDRLVCCEIASRTPGGRLRQRIEQAFEINLDRDWVQRQLELDCASDYAAAMHGRSGSAGHVLIPPQKGELRHVPGECPFDWVSEYRLNGAVGNRYHGGTKSGHSLASFVVRGSSETQVETRLRAVVDWFNQQSEWIV